MSNESTPQSSSVPGIATKIQSLITTHGSGLQVIFVARRNAHGDPGTRAVVVEEAEQLARDAGLNRWAGWGIAWVDDTKNATGAVDDTSSPNDPSLQTVITDLVETGRSRGVVLCAIGDYTSDNEARELIARGAVQAEQHDLLALVVE